MSDQSKLLNLDSPTLKRVAEEHGHTVAFNVAKLAAVAHAFPFKTVTDERERLPSASSMERLALCPGSFALERDHGVRTESPDAATGNRIHEWLAGVKVPLTPEEQDTADACCEQAKRLVDDWMAAHPCIENTETIREERFWARDEGFNRLWSGKPDLVVYAVDHRTRQVRSLVIDYKTGRGDVTQAAGNLQLRALAVLVADESGAKSVRVAIVQPLAGAPTVCDYDEATLDIASVEIANTVRAAMQPGQLRNPTAAGCKYCSAKAACPEGRNLAMAMAQPVPREAGAMLLTPEEMAGFLYSARAAEAVIESVREKARRMLEEDPNAIPGWRLKPGVARESITDPQKVFERVSALGCKPDQFLGAVSVAKGKLEAVVRELTGAKGKALKAAMDGVLEGATETKVTAPSLATDKEVA